MTKRIYLTLLALFLSAGPLSVLYAQDSEDGPIWESIMLVPDNTKLKILGENMRKHNMKYHKEGAFKTTVYSIVSGPNTGKLVWMMGPLKYSDLDARPAAGGHDEDWRDNVMPYVKRAEQGEYWEGDNELSNTAMLADTPPGAIPVLLVRYWEVNPEHGHGVDAHLEMASKAIKAMPGANPWGVYDNHFIQGNLGRHLATVSFFKNWADLSTSRPFRTAFDKVNGADKWNTFVSNRDATFSNWWDEIWVYDKSLSGD
jgi:hypothetical protein